MSKLYLVRHGKCDWNTTHVLGAADRPLTEDGKKDAKIVAELLKSKHIDLIYSSPLQRALGTAREIARHHGLGVIVVKEFTERSHGTSECRLRTEVPEYLEIAGSYDRKFEGGESLRDVEARVTPRLSDLINLNHGRDILIVAHNDVMQAMHRYLTACSVEEMIRFTFERAAVYEYELPSKYDFHLHSTFSDGKNTVDEMAGAAASFGFREIAFTEHFSPLLVRVDRQLNRRTQIRPEDVNQFYQECETAQKKHGIKVLKGFELNYLEFDEQMLKGFVSQYEPDILRLAVHHLELLQDWQRIGRLDKKGYSVYVDTAFEELVRQYGGLRNLCQAYFQRLQNAVKAGFQHLCPNAAVAHLTLFAKNQAYDAKVAEPLMQQALKVMLDQDVALEVNFHYRPQNHEPRPPFTVARGFSQLGGKLFFGSDAHSVDQVAMASASYQEFENNKGHANYLGCLKCK